MAKQDVVRKAFSLTEPVKDIDGTELYELHLREPKTKDLRAIDKIDGEIAGAIALIARLAGGPESSIDEMSLVDLGQITQWLGKLLPSGEVLGA